MDALTLLKEDHQKVKKIMAELEKTTERGVKTRQELFTKLMNELSVHEDIEEQLFYPAVRQAATTKQVEEMIAESYQEHHFVDTIAAEIRKTPFEAEEWGAKFKVMMENIEHHAFEEEEEKLFPKVKRLFDAAELEDLGATMEALKAELTARGDAAEEREESAQR